jgi:hypothetical protein
VIKNIALEFNAVKVLTPVVGGEWWVVGYSERSQPSLITHNSPLGFAISNGFTSELCPSADESFS